MANIDEQDYDEKRLARRSRRKKSQLIAYILLIITLIIIVTLVIFGVRYIKENFKPAHISEIAESSEQTSKEPGGDVVIETPGESQPVQEYSDEDIMNEIVESCIAEMPIEDKLAGLFIVTPEQLTGVETAVKAGSGTQEALSKYAVGGVVYSAKNIKSDDQIKEMLDTTASMSKYPIFTVISDKAVDAEAVRTTLGIEVPEEIEKPENAKEAGLNFGTQLYKYGFNFALTPQMHSMKDGDYISSYVQGFRESGVTACELRFPVMGETAETTDSSDATKEDLVVNEYGLIKPAIDDGFLGAVQMSNVSVPEVAGDDTPASLSEVLVGDELRGTLGFEGVVITAPLNEASITEKYSSAEATVAAIKAGCDMIYLPNDFDEAYEGLLSAVANGSIKEERINDSLRRIYHIKYADKVDQVLQSR